jgi:transglutaminase-like putative cysteine protease
MRFLTVRHVTTYSYSEPVQFGEHRMMFRPRASHDLRLLGSRLDIQPPPLALRWLHDVFDNSVAIATFDTPSAELRFDSTVTLEHIESPRPDYVLEAGARDFPFAYSDDERPDLTGALARQYPADDLTSWTARFLPGGRNTTMGLLLAMTRSIKDEYRYLQRVEKGCRILARRCAGAAAAAGTSRC